MVLMAMAVRHGWKCGRLNSATLTVMVLIWMLQAAEPISCGAQSKPSKDNPLPPASSPSISSRPPAVQPTQRHSPPSPSPSPSPSPMSPTPPPQTGSSGQSTSSSSVLPSRYLPLSPGAATPVLLLRTASTERKRVGLIVGAMLLSIAILLQVFVVLYISLIIVPRCRGSGQRPVAGFF